MKKNLFIAIVFMTFAFNQANASVTVEQSTEPDYIINNGYSSATAEEITIVKSRIAGKPYEPVSAQSHNKFVRFWRNVYGYLDPAQDTDERIHHDIHLSPNVRDL